MWQGAGYVARMDSRDARIAENQALFREMNEILAEWEDRQAAPAERHLFFCECGDVACQDRLFLTMAEYEAVRASSIRFAVLPGHEFPETERVVEEREGFLVVEKFEEARSIVEQSDPRRTGCDDGGRADSG